MHGNQQHSNGRIHEDVCVGKPGFMVVMVVFYFCRTTTTSFAKLSTKIRYHDFWDPSIWGHPCMYGFSRHIYVFYATVLIIPSLFKCRNAGQNAMLSMCDLAYLYFVQNFIENK